MFIGILFRVASARDMFQHKIDYIFKDIPTMFGIADDILVVSYDDDGSDHDRILRLVMQLCY